MTFARRPVATALLAFALLGGCTSPDQTGTPSPSGSSSASSLSPPQSPLPSLSSPPAADVVMAVIGDWGQRGDAVHEVADLVRGIAGDHPLAAVVTTGDNAYQRGRREEAAFADRVMKSMLGPRTRVIASLGNHDVGTASGRYVMDLLDMPARWYTTVVGPVEFVVLDSNDLDDDDQTQFVARTLAAPRAAPWRVVVFHHPPASCSAHKPFEPAVELLDELRGRVDLVLNGHNHTYERFVGPGGLPLVTTGGGGASLYPSVQARCRGAGRAVKLWTVHHALRLSASASALRVEAVDLDKRVFDQFTLRR